MKKYFCLLFLCVFIFYIEDSAQAYRIEISNKSIANTPVFLAGYYGEQVSVIDSVQTDANGKAVFVRNYNLCAGVYTLVVPGKLSYELLLDARQQLNIEWTSADDVRVSGDVQAAAYAGYIAWMNTRPDKAKMVERRNQIIGQHPNTFLAAYLKALQPVENTNAEATSDVGQMMKTYQYRRRHFFDNMPLSDVRLLRTPLYHETVQFYFSKFITQQTDTLIHIAYRMLEQASGNYETFFFMSDFLIDFSLRSKIKDVHKLHNFLLRNRDMLGTKAFTLLPPKSKVNYFKLPDEQALQNRLENMPLTDTEIKTFDPRSIQTKYRVFYFWKNNCARCLTDASKWQAVLNKYHSKSCFGIAVNTTGNVQQQNNRILAYEPLCVNTSISNIPTCAYIFFATTYSKIIVTDTSGSIIGIFGSTASLDNFMMQI